ncbi:MULTISPECIES: PIN domain-containing protein [Legionella]|uniref:PIN domain protein n=2 Tax=Legionella TaxID=445 RepID=A0A0W0XZN5_9GAMM|nr:MULTISPECIES: PIN domain-containing protein [Legionella]KTD49846.1 PIN domain protein [Legionella rubrilucens]RJT46566.1 PIN domain-containing protein [Legionella taurinensis]RJT66658.1 PIN domain-containing protein [Legionella taurinensis]STY25314.1 PIN domain [Legionella taurinensis]
MKNVQNIDNYNFKPSDNVILDTNIWLYNNGPQPPNEPYVGIYSRALFKILNAKCQIFIDALILSEFINRYSRIKYRLHLDAHQLKEKDLSFKDFRKTSDFTTIASDIGSDVRKILRFCKCIESGFELLDINQVMSEFEQGNTDFNDQILSELCKNKGITFVTHDSDFCNSHIHILTANTKLLQRTS